MILLDKQRIVIVTPPKTASSALHDALCKSPVDGKLVIGPSMYDGNIDKHVCQIPNEAEGYLRVVVARHPLDRLVSLYCHYSRLESSYYGRYSMAFWEFANRVGRNVPVTGHPVDKFYQWSISKHIEQIQSGSFRVIKTESIDNDLEEIGVFAKVERSNESYRREWRSYYDQSTIEAIREWASQDCDRFGYTMESQNANA